ncbi:MAG: GNAT family N-acetyltransferase [Deltaproteobacteria bacterium]|nr:GNAT family N-acetyltransferase [Deltaproteobacteria bacterium]
MHLTIRKAYLQDTQDVSAILSEAAWYLVSIGQTLWNSVELSPEHIAHDVENGEYYIAYLNGEPVGTFRYQLEDQVYWPDITDGKSAFIHRLAIRRKAASSGITKQMLDWAKEHTRKIRRDYLRLDCAERPKLCTFYENNGFNKHSERDVGSLHVVRYECRVRT